MKVTVNETVNLTALKGSIVEVTDEQYNVIKDKVTVAKEKKTNKDK